MIAYRDIVDARAHLPTEIIRTPLQVWRHATTLTGSTVHLKLESFQRTGSFKPRGAWNRIRRLSAADLARGIVCASAGNHAQGVAFAAERRGARATIVMPETAPRLKIAQTRLYGDPEIILHGRDVAEALDRAQDLRRERGAVFIHAYDDDDVIAGQGTVGLEIIEQCPAVGTIIVPVGGGGLIAGVARAVRAVKPDVAVIGVQAKGADAVIRALHSGQPVRLESSATIADGINVRVAGARPVAILDALQVPVVGITDEEIRAAMVALCQTAKLVVEPAGAAAAAVALFRRDLFPRRRHVVCLVSGANIDICCYAAVLQAFPAEATATAGLTGLSCTGGEARRSCLGAATLPRAHHAQTSSPA